MTRLLRLLTAAGLVAAAAASAANTDPLAEGERLARKHLLIDTHIDVPYRLQERWEDVSQATVHGEFDYPRARRGGLDVAFMSIYTPGDLEQKGGASELAHRLIDSVEAMVARAPERYALVRSSADIEALAGQPRVMLALGMENGSPIAGSLDTLQRFHARGVRYITLAHGVSNHLADSSYDERRPWRGLSPFGREVVAAMNRLGMMVDVSHLSDDAVRDVLATSRAPVIASHSSARRFTPGWERNLDDTLIRAIAKAGGSVQINFGSGFLTAAAKDWWYAEDAALKAYLKANGFSEGSAAAKAFQADYLATHPFPFASIADVADHIEHVRDIAGIDHVGIGSDFDGVGDTLPNGLKSVADYPNLVAELLRRGWSEADIGKLLGGNLLRVWKHVERVAAEA